MAKYVIKNKMKICAQGQAFLGGKYPGESALVNYKRRRVFNSYEEAEKYLQDYRIFNPEGWRDFAIEETD